MLSAVRSPATVKYETFIRACVDASCIPAHTVAAGWPLTPAPSVSRQAENALYCLARDGVAGLLPGHASHTTTAIATASTATVTPATRSPVHLMRRPPPHRTAVKRPRAS